MNSIFKIITKYKFLVIIILGLLIIVGVFRLFIFIQIVQIKNKGVDEVAKTFVKALNDKDINEASHFLCNVDSLNHLKSLSEHPQYKPNNGISLSYRIFNRDETNKYQLFISNKNAINDVYYTHFVIYNEENKINNIFDLTPCISFQVP